MSHQERIRRISAHFESHGRLGHTRHFIQHGSTTVHAHVHQVAAISLRLNDKFRLKANPDSLVRSALLHDYFLYDWHDKSHEHPRPHGILHPRLALENAKKDFVLNHREQDAILKHMFPLTLKPPRHKEGWILCLADKISTYQELGRWWKCRLKSLWKPKPRV